MSIQYAASTSISRSFIGAPRGPSGSWQTHPKQQQASRDSYTGRTDLPVSVPGTIPTHPQPDLTNWGPHESIQSVPSNPYDVRNPTCDGSNLSYNEPLYAEIQQWLPTAPQYQYALAEQRPHTQHRTHPQAPAQQHWPCNQVPVQTFTAVKNCQRQADVQLVYHSPQKAPQSEFLNFSFTGDTSHYAVPAPATQGSVLQQQYRITLMQSTEHSEQQSNLPL